jgi:hypothetical protein
MAALPPEQDDADAARDSLEGLIRCGHLGGNADRALASLLARQPVVAQRTGACRRSEERLLEQLGERERSGDGRAGALGTGRPTAARQHPPEEGGGVRDGSQRIATWELPSSKPALASDQETCLKSTLQPGRRSWNRAQITGRSPLPMLV